MAETPAKRYPTDRSERARQLVAEGKFGGAEHGRKGGRPRKDQATAPPGETASAFIARAAREDAPKILKVFEDAVKQWIATEDREVEREERTVPGLDSAPEETDLAALNRDQLLDHLAARLAANPIIALALEERLSRTVTKLSADS